MVRGHFKNVEQCMRAPVVEHCGRDIKLGEFCLLQLYKGHERYHSSEQHTTISLPQSTRSRQTTLIKEFLIL
ncbi:hypothetical protein EYC84_008630 [Monilinia fructicola]|uniref:Uncharacterized protein n=1 Tax=Monilinia fructicola TaxID=38448 RepID=A0A5M9JHX2_MONFR|nr:hypothetical protein EYC84_008630 [Monilinia fructicola]